MSNPNKMTCPACKVEMNHHCNKLVYTADASRVSDPGLGGSVEEFHTCPKCGESASRAA